MAEAMIEERHLLKALRWWDGFVIALCNPGFLIASLGFSMGALGTWGAVALWAISAGVGMLQTWIYAETASMFPDKPGGISLYAHEGWRGRFSLVGPIGAFGYWIGWSVVLSIFGVLIGTLIQAQWFPNSTWSVFDGVVHLGLPQFLAIACIVAVWLLNVFGIRPAVWISYVTGAGLLIPLAIFIVGPYVTGNWHSSNMTWALHGWGGFKLAMVYLFLFGWSAYAAEVCATFAPEYHDTRRDTTIALRSAGIFTLLVFLLLRRDRPNWPRPIKVGPVWLGIAAVLVVFNAVLIIFGITNPTLTGYGTWTDMFIGVGVLIGSVVLFFYRRIVQDKQAVTFTRGGARHAVRRADGAAARGGGGHRRLTPVTC
jgi:amino acid transporter